MARTYEQATQKRRARPGFPAVSGVSSLVPAVISSVEPQALYPRSMRLLRKSTRM